jgi:L-lactate dehydrogenase complex protein LldG
MGGARTMSRERILENIRRALNRAAPADPAALEARLREAPPGPLPARGQVPRAQRIELFVEMARRAKASVKRVAGPADVPAAIADYLASENLPARLRLAPDKKLTGLDWKSRPLIEISTGPSDGGDAVSLSHAEAGIAETGTLMMASGAESPTTLNFLPETEIVLLPAEDVVGAMEEGWARLRARLSAAGMGKALPRTVNFITGPSRSADIGLKLQMGAHGPRRLHILVVGD